MCGPDKFPRFQLTAKAWKRCDQGDDHPVDNAMQFYEHAHDLYRGAKAFYEKNGKANIEMTIRIAPEETAKDTAEKPA